MKMIERVRQAIIGVNLHSEKREQAQEIRKGALQLAAAANKPGKLLKAMQGFADMAAAHATEAAAWLTTADIEEGESGPFDACDLTAWLAIAAKAGVPAVPARIILHLSEEEAEAASGDVALPTGPIPERIRARLRAAIETDPSGFGELASHECAAPADVDRDALVEKLYASMDGIPEGWMVRTSRCGGSELKALAGTGLAGSTAPEVKFGPDLEIGPGWVRNGNRRRVNTTDSRTIKVHASGPHRGMTFLARPWVEAARFIEADDPHRHGSPFEGPGHWPMEWRAFVKGGRCIGVSVYYAWTGAPTPENARMAIKVRELAQRIVDQALSQGLEPRLMDVELGRLRPETREMLDRDGFGPGTFCCCLDFIETADGLLLLEGGPGHTPLGGGHPCGFAGTAGKPILGNAMTTEGVAFRPMNHVLIGDPRTWHDGCRSGCISTWDEAQDLAEMEA